MNTQTLPETELPADLWKRDEPLRRAAELIDQSAGDIRAVSFDFFDTIVWRMVEKPVDVFIEVGHRLGEEKLLRAGITAAEYQVLRRHGEIKTRERQNAKDHTQEDIRISDIYSGMQAVVPKPAAAVPIEFGAERDLCILNPIMGSFIRYLVARGLKVIVVSDIYYSAEDLKEILRANQFDPEMFELVITSADAGVCKGTGNLFKRALKAIKLDAAQVLHIGDNYQADVIGARRAGVRGCHYPQASNRTETILAREKFLLGGQQLTFNANSLRKLAARLHSDETDEGFFGQMGAVIMGPTLTRYASWACEQFVAAGVRKVGAFMREGELFGQLLQQEAIARGYDLEITPLYVNRKATDLAAIGRLTATNLLAWLEARPTLPIRTILEHFGLRGETVRHLPMALNERADRPEKIIQLAQFLFTPEIAQRIEARSAEERRKVLDYMKPWLEGGQPFGVCDIGYSASAQTQLKRILGLENVSTPMVGCYLVSYERAADRVLDGVDIRSFLGAYGHPDFYYRAFIRSPAFMEQSITAASGTTLGYERLADGTVKPVLDDMPYDAEMLRRQKAFKAGVLEFQKMWHWVGKLRPGMLDNQTDFSRRILADVDKAFAPILVRATSFPTGTEVERFGSLQLDDYYFQDSYKPLCGTKDREAFRKNGYAKALGQAGVHWPHGLFHLENPRTATEFFSCGKALLLCDTDRDGDGAQPDLSIVLAGGCNPVALRECVNRLKAVSNRDLRYEVLLIVMKENKEMMALAQELAREVVGLRIYERGPQQGLVQQLNCAADTSFGPLVMFMDEGALLPPGWDAPLLKAIRARSDIGMVLPRTKRHPEAGEDALATTLRGFVMRRAAFVESLGLNEELTPTGALWNLMLRLRESKWATEICGDVTVEIKASEIGASMYSFDRALLKQRCAGFAEFAAEIVAASQATTASLPANRPSVRVDWIGSFLDHGSLSHVNRELTGALAGSKEIQLQRVNNAHEQGRACPKELASHPGTRGLGGARSDAAVTVRHAWPPDWQRPASGKLVVIQPWEFGAIPEQWVQDLARVDECWVPSNYVRQMYVGSGVSAEKVFVVPNGVDTGKFNPQAAPMKLATSKKFKFLFVGGTIHRKGPDLLLQAYLAQFTRADDVCLVIKDFGGQNVYAGQTFEGQIRAAQAQPNAPEILYINQELPPDALPGLYTACDCLVLPYRGEGFGLPVLEAMACALPVIVTAGGATDDFVRADFGWRVRAEKRVFGSEVSGMKLAGAGWLLEPDATALSAAMREAFANPAHAKQLGMNGAVHARENYSWQAVAKIAAQRVNELTGKRNEFRVPEAPALERNKSRGPAAKITLPACGLLGQLGGARELVKQKKSRQAWELTLGALEVRPYHPEAYLLLAEIARLVGANGEAKVLADGASKLAPGWKPAKQFLNQRLKGGSRPEWMKLPATSERSPRLSVCLIVKNEEKFLGQCLQSVRGLAQQIVVVDTGSTDRTVAIAKEHGAEVHSFVWCDDFSAARNAALEHVTGDWVLMLDADEELSAKAHEQLAQALKHPAVMAWRLPIVNVGQEAEGCSYVPRLFRNAPGLFYIGRVHEQVFSSLEVRRAEWGLENRLGDVTLIHHGYTEEVTRDRNKVERNLRLLEQAIVELPDEPHLLMNLGLELARSGREAEALGRYREAFDTLSAKPAAEVVPEFCETLLTQLCARLAAARRPDEVVRVLTSPLAKPVLTASLHFSLGLAHLELKQFSEAANQMRQCLAKRAKAGLAPINKDILTCAPHHCLAVCLAQVGDAAGADLAFQGALEETGSLEAVRLDYAQFLAGQGKAVEALHRLHEIVTANPAQTLAWLLGGKIALSQMDFLEFGRDWTAEAIQQHPADAAILAQRAEVLLLSGDTAGALEAWQKVATLAPGNAALGALILCETIESATTQAPNEGPDEAAVSRAFIAWYQKLIAAGANEVILGLNERTEKLGRALPTAAKILETVIAEANEPAALVEA